MLPGRILGRGRRGASARGWEVCLERRTKEEGGWKGKGSQIRVVADLQGTG